MKWFATIAGPKEDIIGAASPKIVGYLAETEDEFANLVDYCFKTYEKSL